MIRSNVHCTNCFRDFVVEMDLSLDGNHEIVCPWCAHTHYRVVRDGEVTEERYRSSGGAVIVAYTYAASTTTGGYQLANSASASANAYTMQLWFDRSDLTHA